MNKSSKYGYLFTAPFFIVFTIFTVVPLLITLYYSFTDYNGFSSAYVGVDQYKAVLIDDKFWTSFKNTWIIWGMNYIVQIVLALLVATLIMDFRVRLKASGFFRTMFFLPNLMTAASVAFLFSLLLNKDYGAVNRLLETIGLIDEPIPWLISPIYAQFSTAMIGAWMWFGNTAIIIMAGMTSVPISSYESAWLDGTNRFQVLKDITLPSIKPVLFYVLLTSLIGGLQMFDIPFLLTDGLGAPGDSLLTMSMYLYLHAFQWSNVGYAAAISFVMFVFILILSSILRFVMSRGDN